MTRLLQPVTRGRLAAVAAVQSKATFQFRDAGIGCRQLPFQCHNLLVLQGALREQQLNLLNQPLDVGGSLHPTLESDSPLRHQLLHTTESIRRTAHQSGPESLESAITGPGTCTATWGVTKMTKNALGVAHSLHAIAVPAVQAPSLSSESYPCGFVEKVVYRGTQVSSHRW
jgi:hypothetical protein